MALALDKNSQKTFSTAISKIKKSLQEGKIQVNDKLSQTARKKKRAERGVVYLGHIPHGFYEEQMQGFFSQFGKVTRVRLSRSKKTGNSKGYAFIQFLHPEVAKIVAETMNNYLMCNRLLKAEYIPPDRQHSGIFKGRDWSKTLYPTLKKRQKCIRNKNKIQSDEAYEKFVKKQFAKVESIKKLLKSHGIEYDFKFSDIPYHINLIQKMKQKQANSEPEIDIKTEIKKEPGTDTEIKSEESSSENSSDIEDTEIKSEESSSVNSSDIEDSEIKSEGSSSESSSEIEKSNKSCLEITGEVGFKVLDAKKKHVQNRSGIQKKSKNVFKRVNKKNVSHMMKNKLMNTLKSDHVQLTVKKLRK